MTENVLQHDASDLGLAMSHALAICALLTGKTQSHIQCPHHDLPVSCVRCGVQPILGGCVLPSSQLLCHLNIALTTQIEDWLVV